jgi:hypothetical protein
LRASGVVFFLFSSWLFAGNKPLYYHAKWVQLGSSDSPVCVDYVVIERQEKERFPLPDRDRTRVAKALVELLRAEFKASVRKHGAMTPEYEQDVDARLDLVLKGKATAVALLGIDSLTGETEVFAMAVIYPDFGGGVPLLRSPAGHWIRSPSLASAFGVREERVRVFGSGRAYYLDENEVLSDYASHTPLYWGAKTGIALFAVPRTRVIQPDPRWAPGADAKASVDWKTLLLNMAVADGLLRWSKIPLSKKHRLALPELDPSSLSARQKAFSDVGKEPYIPGELLGIKPQTHYGVSEIVVYSRSGTLVELFFKPLGFQLARSLKEINADGTEGQGWNYFLSISREQLEYHALEKLRSGAEKQIPGLKSAQVGRVPFQEGSLGVPPSLLIKGVRRCVDRILVRANE